MHVPTIPWICPLRFHIHNSDSQFRFILHIPLEQWYFYIYFPLNHEYGIIYHSGYSIYFHQVFPPKWLVYFMESPPRMDDDWGYPYDSGNLHVFPYISHWIMTMESWYFPLSSIFHTCPRRPVYSRLIFRNHAPFFFFLTTIIFQSIPFRNSHVRN